LENKRLSPVHFPNEVDTGKEKERSPKRNNLLKGDRHGEVEKATQKKGAENKGVGRKRRGAHPQLSSVGSSLCKPWGPLGRFTSGGGKKK